MQSSVLSPTAMSPCFGYLSPPIDASDASSDEGDTLHTPVTEHDEHHPCAVYDQHQFAQSAFHSYTHTQKPTELEDVVIPENKDHVSFPSLSKLLAPSASERLSDTHSHASTYFSSFSPSSNALDLANASLEFNPFAASFHTHASYRSSQGLEPAASPYTLARQTFDTQSSFPSASEDGPSSTALLPLPSMSVSMEGLDPLDAGHTSNSLLFAPASRPTFPRAPISEDLFNKGRMYSPRFPADHTLNSFFVRTYHLGDELGAGGYGFVMTARHRTEGHEVAVKFIIKDKVPDHAWWEDDILGRVPTEVMVMSLVNHENIVRCLDLYEDEMYFYLVQELHGTPWMPRKKRSKKQVTAPGKLIIPTLPTLPPPALNLPSLTPSPSSESTVDSLPATPPLVHVDAMSSALNDEGQCSVPEQHPLHCDVPALEDQEISQSLLQPASAMQMRPNFTRRPSHDLFECIEQSKHKRLSENHARYIFAQVVEAVHYLNSQGITHCDIKDENLVVDSDFKVKLIDFGSAVVADPNAPRPYYTLFFGTTAYASSEILLKRPYRAAPAEIWTLGVLLSYLLTGHSPFPSEQDAIDGRVVVREPSKDKGGAGKLSRAALSLMGRCLERDPDRRADIDEVRGHRWLHGALEKGVKE